jgi:hypothetical protein
VELFESAEDADAVIETLEEAGFERDLLSAWLKIALSSRTLN